MRFHGFGAIHCETLATRLYVKSCGVLQLARRHVCFAPFSLGVFLSVVTCACHAVYLSVWQSISSLTLDMISNGITKRINL